MAKRDILNLGNPNLYVISTEIKRNELGLVSEIVADLHDTMMAFREEYKRGRAIAAPQIGIPRRLVYMHVDSPMVFINPVLTDMSADMMTVWDDCMSFPELLVKVRRHQSCRIEYRNLDWQACSMELDSDLSELLQHEIDHLDGILATQRAIDNRAIALRSQRHLLTGADMVNSEPSA
ncbi:MAG: peptide deformylase [candidate division Zixibacteria bacterium]|nr:peptide deformylase [candidate division Zixibacteria bacterium]